MTLPATYNSAPKQIEVLTLPALRDALKTAAELVRMDGAYLPIYERLERDLHQRQAKTSSLDRALYLAETGKQFG